MKHTFKTLKAQLAEHGHDAVLVAVAAVFVGLAAVQNASDFDAHFLQRSLPSRYSVEQPFNITTRTTVALTEHEDLRGAAKEETSSIASEEHASSSEVSSSSVLSVITEVIPDFPALSRTVHPVSKVPDWGAMRTQTEWNRPYSQMGAADFVKVPAYDLKTLTIPLSSLVNPIKQSSIPVLTAKLYYSTRYMAKYDLDADEFSGAHDGVDLKLALGTPVGSVAGGRVYAVREDNILGKHVLIEHRTTTGQRYLSEYGHLQSASVQEGDTVEPGQIVGRVGMTGNTSGPHLHLAIHKAASTAAWNQYEQSESINPMTFLAMFANGE